jgi:nucleoside 2-deoxyribosyltransferase
MMKIYLAAPLFSQQERRYNRLLAARLQERLPHAEVVLPQDFRVGPGGGTYNDRRHLQMVYKRCMAEIRAADALLALLDGADADSGVAFEVGFARGLDKPVLGVRTDFRQLQVKGLNVMLAEGCSEVLCHFSFDEDLDHLVEAIIARLEKLSA